jgi:predicted nuclease of predicted toxin-antitoxin system
MRVLADHCVYGKTVRLLRAHGCEVVTLHQLGQADASDGEVLALAQSLDAVLITNDKGFGNILVYPPARHEGVIVLRMKAAHQERVHRNMLGLLRLRSRGQSSENARRR